MTCPIPGSLGSFVAMVKTVEPSGEPGERAELGKGGEFASRQAAVEAKLRTLAIASEPWRFGVTMVSLLQKS